MKADDAPRDMPRRRPMLHFFPRFARNAAESPFNDYLRATGARYDIIASEVQQTYPRRWQLFVLGYPRLLWSALHCAARSLFSSRENKPDAVIISSDVESLAFAWCKALPGAARPAIVFMPFIFTNRLSARLAGLQLAYYRLVLRHVAVAICHSQLEVQRYSAIFGPTGTRFVFVPWGTFVPDAADILAQSRADVVGTAHPRVTAVAAGRSGRDYATFVQAAQQANCAAVIICNDVAALRGISASETVVILSRCFRMDYLRQLLTADIVVVPLLVDDISAGQMVIIQAMALGRPLIVTDTLTVHDYLEHDYNALLVPLGDVTAMADALLRLSSDPALRQRMGGQARSTYLTRFSGAVHAAAVVAAVEHYVYSQSPADAKARMAAS